MNNLNIVVEKTTGRVDLPTNAIIGRDGENLQTNLVFTFKDKFVNGSARLEYETDKKYPIPMTKTNESYTIPVKNVLTKEGRIKLQLVVVETAQGEEIPVFKSNEFYLYCESSINATEETPSTYEYWLDVIQEKLGEMDNINITASKTGDTATIEVTNRLGAKTSVQVKDGAKGETGATGADAKINGKNAIKIEAGTNVTIDETTDGIKINSTGGGGTGAVNSVNGKTGTVVLNANDVGALPNTTVIPTKTSQITNDSGYITNSYHDNTKQDVISDLNTIRTGASKGATALQSVPSDYKTKSENDNLYQAKGNYYNKTEVDNKVNVTFEEVEYTNIQDYNDAWTESMSTYMSEEFEKKQNKLTSSNAGTNVTITEESGVVKINSTGGITPQDVDTKISTHNTSSTAHEDIRELLDDLMSNKVPNVVATKDLTITNGVMSGFDDTNYAKLPFKFNHGENEFEIDFKFTTSDNITDTQSIFDSNFGFYVDIDDRTLHLGLSSDGTNWDIGTADGGHTLEEETDYYCKLKYENGIYTLYLSEDGEEYDEDILIPSSLGIYPREIYIGGGNDDEIGLTNPFDGTFDLNFAKIIINDITIWKGMDLTGIDTRANVSLSNLDSEGQAKFDAKQDTLTAGTNITIQNNVISATGGGTSVKVVRLI